MNLDGWRSRINDLDNQILDLLNQRAEAALHIGDLKRRQDAPSYVPEREAEVLRRLTSRNPGPLAPAAVADIWVQIISACRVLEEPLTVAYLGPAATFTHQAARERFGAAATLVPTRTIGEVFDEVERGRAAMGVVPVENSTEGAVNITLDRLVESDVVVCGEIYLDIAQQLLSHATDLGEIKRVLSHPQGLAQCRNWLAERLPGVPTEETTSTSAAAEQAAADPSLAAIASSLAGELYHVPVLRARIEDLPDNSTRFLLIGRQPTAPTGHDKTSIVFAMKDEPGVLYRINLSKIESRPAKRRPWKHVSFVDLDGHRESEAVGGVLREIAERTVFLKVLGSYPAA
jgi:chorismate mutase / prephenate dehydratase